MGSRLDSRIKKLENAAKAGGPDDVRIVWGDDAEIPPGNPTRWYDDAGNLHIRLEWGDDDDEPELELEVA